MFELEITPNTLLSSAEIQGSVPAVNFTDVTTGDEDWQLYADGDSFYIKNVTDSLNGLIFDGSANATFLAGTTVSVDKLTLLDTNDSHSLGLVWNENDTVARTLNLLVAGGDRSITLNENFTIGNGFDITLTAEDVAGSIVLDEQTFEVEGEGTATQLFKLVNSTNAATTLTVGGTTLALVGGTNTFSLTAGTASLDIAAGSILDVNANLTVESTSAINQDVTSDASPTFAGLALGSGSITMSGSLGVTGTRVLKGWFADLEVTGAIVGSITGNAATVTSFTPASGSITLDGADAITLRSTAATDITLPTTGTLATLAGAETLSTKLIQVTAAPGSDHLASGTIIALTANENQAFGDVCYINADGQAQLADASVIATASAVVMCADASIAADASGNYLLYGIARDDTNAWTPGGLIYLTITGTTGNTLSQTAPTGTDEVTQILGVATHADRLLFMPNLFQTEHI